MRVGSIKGNIGHCETAAEVAGLLKALVMVNKAAIPPLASHHSLNPKIPAPEPDRLSISRVVEKWEESPRAALVNSYGAAGSNSAILLCQAPNGEENSLRTSTSEQITFPIILTAASKASLVANATNLSKFLRADNMRRLADISYTLVERRKRHQIQWMSTESSVDDLTRSLESLQNPSESPQAKKVILTFSGQSRQSVGLNRDWYDTFPLFRDHVDACDDLLRQSGFPSCKSVMFEKEPTTDVVSLQCAIFTIQYASVIS